MTPEQQAYLAERQQILKSGTAFRTLIETDGWRELLSFQKTYVVRMRHDLRNINTADKDAACDAIRKWQLAEEYFELQNGYIEKTIEQAVEISGQRTLEEALLTEKMNEQPQPTQPGTTDTAGY